MTDPTFKDRAGMDAELTRLRAENEALRVAAVTAVIPLEAILLSNAHLAHNQELRHYVANAPMLRRWSLAVVAAVIVCGAKAISPYSSVPEGTESCF